MKRKYIMLTLLIPGPKEAGNNIDVYLQPLIEDLKLLWDQGYTIKGAKACPICEDATIDLRLKNYKKSIIGTLLNIPGKMKDGMKARLDLQELGVRAELAPQQSGKRAYLPPACYTLSRKEKISFCECLSSVKVPSGYSSNLKNLISMKDLKLVVTHLVREIKICGPLYVRQMYPFERFLCILKAYVRNRRHPEASIAEGYSVEETIEFCTDYLASTDPVGIPRSRHEGRLDGQGTVGHKMITPGAKMFDRAHLFVLQHMTEVNPYLQEHVPEIRRKNPSKGGKWVTNEHNRSFVKWFKDRFMSQYSKSPSTVSNTLKWLAYGPNMPLSSFQEFERGNFVASRDVKKSYYGVIEEIWEIDYKDFKVALFKCKWFDIRRGVRVDESGFTLVDFSPFGHEDDPSILATQVKQVFYIRDPADVRWSIVLQGKRCIIGVDNVEDEEEYNQFDENPPFSIGLQTTSIEDSTDISYARNDHDEGGIRLMDQDQDRREHNREEDREQDREQSSEELVKKRSRGPTLCKNLKRRIAKQNLDCSISFNEYGEPIGDMLKDFRTYVGSVTRWKLDDSRKKNVLERAGKQWRDFKGKLTKNYFREGKDLCEKYSFITEDTWKTFKQRSETPEFKEISEKAKENQKHNEHVHYLGPSGYASKRTMWSIDDPIISLNDHDCSNLSLLSTERTGRGFDWLRACARADGQVGHYFPNKKTKDVCLTMNELHNQASEGSWTPQGHDDLLARALGNKEHGDVLEALVEA
ncbi:hypothetical protein AgCh_002474 [Apium graveolens]